MKIKLVIVNIAICLLLVPHHACSKPQKEAPNSQSVQRPVVAGAFYPGDPSLLKKEVREFLSKAPKKTFDGNIMGVIAPHAGYRYSGPVAGAAFKQIEGKHFDRVVVMAPSHRVPIDGVAFTNKGSYRTPLGDIPIDVETVRELVNRYSWAKFDESPYLVEHSLEVELPFLQEALKDFKIIPMIIGAHAQAVLDDIVTGLEVVIPKEGTLYVASSDLSHFLSYDAAVDQDGRTLSYICDKNVTDYHDAVKNEKASLCGSSPVYVLKRLAENRGAKLVTVEYANSGDTTGDRSRVVGYAAVVAVEPQSLWLGDRQKAELLDLAKKTLYAHVQGKALPPLTGDPALKRDGAAFVTLKKHGELRGCIGHIIAAGPLDRCVQDMAVAASTSDPRFPPVRPNELKDITIEISVLTPPEKLSDPLAVRVGTDGLIIEKGFHRGVLLPQVPAEQGWNKQQYLEGICRKAGLPSDAWKDAKLERFQAIVFGE